MATEATSNQPRWARWIGPLAILHFSLIALALSANLSPSALQSQLLQWFAPYLRTANWELGQVPLELTQGNELEGPFRVEVLTADSPAGEWSEYPWSSLNLQRPLRDRFAKQFAFLGIQQEEAAFALASSLARSYPQRFPALKSLRVLRLPTETREEWIYRQEGLEATAPEVCFEADAVRLGPAEITWVPRQESRRSSRSLQKPSP
jgi:hypothetical protein